MEKIATVSKGTASIHRHVSGYLRHPNLAPNSKYCFGTFQIGITHCNCYSIDFLATREGSASAAAAEMAAVSLQKRPDAEALALWFADAVLAHRLQWPAPVPLIAGQIRRSDLRGARDHDGRARGRRRGSSPMPARRAAAADLYAELTRRAHHLLVAAPKLCARDAAPRVENLLTEDAQAAAASAVSTDRAGADGWAGSRR
jgi:Protein of unknown function (DUF1403)